MVIRSKLALVLLPLVAMLVIGCGGDADVRRVENPTPTNDGGFKLTGVDQSKLYFATIKTNHGSMIIELLGKEAPKTVNNFITLSRDDFYDNLIFHRVIPRFMIQGGDPSGNGTGGPGYKFEDEFDNSLKFDQTGLLAMANAGPNTNGSQFFITTAPAPHLTGKHTIFGRVLDGQHVAEAISRVTTGPRDKPLEDVVIEDIEIEERDP